MKTVFLFLLLCCTSCWGARAQSSAAAPVHPLDLEFHRLAVRRFIFSNNLPLSEFKPAELVSFTSMHPAFSPSKIDEQLCDTTFRPLIRQGRLLLNRTCGRGETTFYVGGVNPYATYDLDIHSITPADTLSVNAVPAEVGIEVARFGLNDRIQLLVRASARNSGIYLRVFHNGQVEREECYARHLPQGPFKLRMQLYGHSLAAFVEQHGQTTYLGHIPFARNFMQVIDFRDKRQAARSTFNVFGNLQGEVLINGASSYLSCGMGQADIRLISYEDLSPYMDDNRLWFTFSCRGIETCQSVQGILSLDPSVFDVRFEGMIVFDHGDGLLRNDYASHLFYDRRAGEWRAWACDFGGTRHKELRSGTGLLTAVSARDPRRGFSVMQACRVDTTQVRGHNEDPCIFYDAEAGKWRLLTSVFIHNNIICGTFESDTWNGTFRPMVEPVKMNSTGTSIQRIGGRPYIFMGGTGNLRVHQYPDLKLLGELNLDLQPHWPRPAGRVWASLVPLPAGYPYRYVLLTMDRPNFPGINSPNWSYGALYFYGAD